MKTRTILALVVAATLVRPVSGRAAVPDLPPSFMAAKTVFQVNVGFDPRIAIAADGVIVHRHGDKIESLGPAIESWRREGYLVGRMFFADSDAGNLYWTGKWDGRPHPDEVERNAKNEVVQCEGVRPYMLPTEGWTRYLEEMAAVSVDAGAMAVLPEEPLAHVNTGYEKAFQALWVKRYKRPWQAEDSSPEARFLTAQLKNELYIELQRRLGRAAKARGDRVRRRISFVIPVHGLYSNIASHLVAPLGTSLAIREADGYIGQVWTGPVNWALANYDSPDKSFFASAYVLYDYFVELTVGTGRKLWLLADPVEDDPNHQWAEFQQWYRHCLVAKLMFPEVDAFEVMPWPERIFLPGYTTGGGTPAPESFRIAILSAVQVLQEVPRGGEWYYGPGGEPAPRPTGGIGIAVSDTAMWQPQKPPLMQGTYGLFMPLVQAGVPAAACVAERSGDPRYMARFHTIVLSYETWKPTGAEMNAALAAWVRRGGSLLLFGAADDLGGAAFWWRKAGHASPLHHLLAELGIRGMADGEWNVGRGWVVRRGISPMRFGDPAVAGREYMPLVARAVQRAGPESSLTLPGAFCMRRGPFVAAHAVSKPATITGELVDVLDPELPVIRGVRLPPGSSALYRDVTPIMRGMSPAGNRPVVLHATHRLMMEDFRDGLLALAVRGPALTPAVVRVYRAGLKLQSAEARDGLGRQVNVETAEDGPTVRLRFANDPSGVTVEAKWKKEE